MKEKPIIFSGEMVRAILAGNKTQTRRVMNPQPVVNGHRVEWHPKHAKEDHGMMIPCARWHSEMPIEQTAAANIQEISPWPVGTRLWVRESFTYYEDPEHGEDFVQYLADDQRVSLATWEFPHPVYEHCIGRFWKTVSGRYMPRWASRITLEVTDVRVERVQDISEEDAQDEGVPWPNPETDVVRGKTHPTCIDVFAALWDKINGERGVCKTCKGTGLVSTWGGSLAGGSLEQTADDCPDCHGEDKSYQWANNPWVWVVTFRRID